MAEFSTVEENLVFEKGRNGRMNGIIKRDEFAVQLCRQLLRYPVVQYTQYKRKNTG